MRYLLFCLLLSLSSCNPLTKAANAEVALLEQKQELAKTISNWYGKQVTDCISSADVLMKSNEIK